jgi:hypothetical protein
MEEVLTIEHFRPHVGNPVRFKGAAPVFSIDRVEGEGGAPPANRIRVPFIVIFRGPPGRDALLPEGLYECEIGDGPTFALHVAPIHTHQRDRQEYQAVFN